MLGTPPARGALCARSMLSLATVASLTFSGRVPLPRPAVHHLCASRSVAPVALAPAELWTDYLGLLETAPLVTKAVTAGIIIGAGDATAQLLEKRGTDEGFDVVRALRWAVFGLVLQGPWNHAFYLLLDGALPPTPDPFTLTTLEKVGIDQFVQAYARHALQKRDPSRWPAAA